MGLLSHGSLREVFSPQESLTGGLTSFKFLVSFFAL